MKNNDEKIRDLLEEVLPKLKELRNNNEALSNEELVKYFLKEFKDKEKLTEVLDILKKDEDSDPSLEEEFYVGDGNEKKICYKCKSDDLSVIKENVDLNGFAMATLYKCNKCGAKFHIYNDDQVIL